MHVRWACLWKGKSTFENKHSKFSLLTWIVVRLFNVHQDLPQRITAIAVLVALDPAVSSSACLNSKFDHQAYEKEELEHVFNDHHRDHHPS